MRRVLIGAAACLVAAVGGYGYLVRVDPSPGNAPFVAGAPATASQLARGEYLARSADCIACHTRPGGRPFAGGLAFKLPFGTIYSSNITPDAATGIGAWSDDDFVRAVHDGVRKDGARLYPAFPYTSYTLLDRSDVLAIKTYLFSLPAVRQATPQSGLGFPFNQRWAMGVWNAVFFKDARFASDPTKSAQWNSGAYLAIALAHCTECHTPRNIGFALDHGNELAGAPLEGWRAPNITPDPRFGIGRWTDSQIIDYLVRGHADGRGSAGGPMGEAVANSMQYLEPQDAQALVAYLRGVPPRAGQRSVEIATATSGSPTDAVHAAGTLDGFDPGLKLFESACASCHRWDGRGQETPYASLAGAYAVNDPTGDSVTEMILHGVDTRIGATRVFMPSFASYTDTEIAEMANYVIGHFGAKAGRVTPESVERLRGG